MWKRPREKHRYEVRETFFLRALNLKGQKEINVWSRSSFMKMLAVTAEENCSKIKEETVARWNSFQNLLKRMRMTTTATTYEHVGIHHFELFAGTRK